MEPTTLYAAPKGLAALKQILSSPQPQYVTLSELTRQGLTEEEATLVLELGTHVTAIQQRLALYESEANKPLLQKQQEIQIKMLESMAESNTQTMTLLRQLKESLIDNASGTLGAFTRVLNIYTAAFILGFLLIITAVVFAAMDKTVLAIAFGTIGLIDIMTYFFKLPASQIQESRSNLSQLQVVLLVWMKEFVNNDALCAKMLNVEQPSLENYKILAEINIDNTAKLLKMIQDFAEPRE